MTVVITVLVVGKGSGGGESPTPTNGDGSEFASANDKGPVAIITEDPTCAAWGRINDAVVSEEKRVGWSTLDQSVPASAWNLDQRSMYDTIGKAMRNAADQTVGSLKLTPHRVIRELYEQFIAYSRALAEKIPRYTAADKEWGTAPDTVGSSLVSICAANHGRFCFGIVAVGTRGRGPSNVASAGDPDDPQPFLTKRDPVCSEWASALARYDVATSAWQAVDPAISAPQWTPTKRHQ